MARKQRGKVIRGTSGAEERSAFAFRPRASSKWTWKGPATLWGGAIIVGLTVGLAPSLSSGAAESDWPTGAIRWNEVQDPPGAALTLEDEAWMARGAPWSEVRSARGAPMEDTGRGQLVRVSETAAPTNGLRASFSYCHSGGGRNCVVDGDTIWLEGQKVRLADIDAPETHDPRCPEEKALGDQATRRLQQLLNAGSVTLSSYERDEDRYGRKLRIVLVDGTSAGDTLVSEGLARPYAGGRRPWC